MRWNRWVRDAHRWMSIVFTLAVVANLVALWLERQETWIGLVALVPLMALLLSGLQLFLQPYRRSSRGADGAR